MYKRKKRNDLPIACSIIPRYFLTILILTYNLYDP